MILLQMTGMNLMFVPMQAEDGDWLKPLVELVLVGTRPQYRPAADGQLEKGRTAEEARFLMSVDELRGLAAALTEYADSVDEVTGARGAVKLSKERPAGGSPGTQTPAM